MVGGVTRYQATPKAVESGLPVVGTLSDWQARHEHILLSSLFGNVLRVPPASGRNNGTLRLAVLESLATTDGISHAQLATDIGESNSRVNAAIRELEEQHVVVVGRKVDRNQQQLVIDPAINSRAETKYYRATNPAILGALAVARQHAADARYEVSANDFLASVQTRYPGLGADDVWAALVKSKAQGRLAHLSLPGLADKSARTEIFIDGELEPAIRELTDSTKALKKADPHQLEAGTRAAKLILSEEPLTASRLVVTAKRAVSNSVKSEPETPDGESTHTSTPVVAGGAAASIPKKAQASALEETVALILHGVRTLNGDENEHSVVSALQTASTQLEEASQALRGVDHPNEYTKITAIDLAHVDTEANIRKLQRFVVAASSMFQDYVSTIRQ
jgi:hypothetical protein